MLISLFAVALAQDLPPASDAVGAGEGAEAAELEGAAGAAEIEGELEPEAPAPELPRGLASEGARLESPYTDPSQLPDVIRIKTPYQSYNNLYYFALVNGLLYAKPREVPAPGEPEVVTPGGWALFYGTGLPFRERSDRKTTTARGFISVEGFERITADDDELVAIGVNGMKYFKREHATRRFDEHWYDEWGFPIRGDFHVPDDGREAIAWGIGRRRIDSTGYFTDPDGDPHVSGFGISTVYYLDRDGETIWYADTGLPPRLAHRMCAPERNTVKMVNLSASASTMMVIDASGQVWTRLADYDTTGGTPGHRYTYEDEPLDGLDPYDIRTIDTNMALPPEDWTQQPLIFPDGAPGFARLSAEISVVQNGEGNDARELRVVGTDEAGRAGYYLKQLAEPAWSFQEAELSLSWIQWLDPEAVNHPVTQYGEGTGSTLHGFMEVRGGEALPLTIERWDPVCTPAEAKVTLPTGQVVSFELHTVDAWTPWREEDPGFEGRLESSLTTLWVSEEALTSDDPVVREFVEDNLSPLHRQTFAMWSEGNQDRVVIEPRGVWRSPQVTAVAGDPGSLEVAEAMARAAAVPATWVAEAEAAALHDPAQASVAQLESAIAGDRAMLEAFKDEKRGFAADRRGSVTLSTTLVGVNVALRLTGVRLIGRLGDHFRPRVKRPTKLGVWTSKVSYVIENTTSMVIRSAKKDKLERQRAREEYAEVRDLLGARIERYEEELERRD